MPSTRSPRPARPPRRVAWAYAVSVACAAVAAAGAPVPRAGAQAPDAAVVAFENVTVLPMDRDRRLPGQTVVVRDGRIAAVGPSRSVRVPAGARRVDGRGKFLMPGLAEMHAHVPPEQSVTEEQLRDIMFLYVANGVTTIRGMLGASYQLALRDRLARGELLGPTFFVGAPSLSGGTAPNPDTAAALVRAHKRAGYDFLKLHPGLSRATYDAIVRTGREVGITWAGHVSTGVGLARTLEARQGSIDHLDAYVEAATPAALQARLMAPGGGVKYGEVIAAADEAAFAALARRTREAGVFNVPTAFLWESFYSPDSAEAMAARPEMRYVSAQQVAAWTRQKRDRARADASDEVTPALAARYVALRRAALKALADAGAPLLMGTDSPQMFNVPGFALQHELGVMRAAGLTPFQILQSGTANVARYARESLKLDGRFGTVAAGQRADLVLLDADPLADLTNLTRRAGVMVRGRWVPREEIERGLAELAAKHAR